MQSEQLLSVAYVSDEDARIALVYTDGILDYDRHDRILRDMGYDYLALPCRCGGSDDDGHLPTCGWGRKLIHDQGCVAEGPAHKCDYCGPQEIR